MSSLVFKKLVIFSPVEELAKVVDLQPGLNIVTSKRKNGNDLGKSLIAKSFYHCLGADCRFDDKFDEKSKVFVVVFEHCNKEYSMYRSGKLFKLFDSNGTLMWSTTHRHDLGQKLYELFGFAIWLPSRETQETEIAPPAYSYAPYFVDQNQYGGSDFKSFEKLTQYPSFKESLIYTFTGVYDEGYFSIKARKESLSADIAEAKSEIELNKAMIEHVEGELAGLGYSASMASLERDCDDHETKYRGISEKLGKLRDQLYELREERAQTELALSGSKALGKHLDKRIDEFVGDICPFCKSHIDDPVSARVAACVAHTDTILLADELNKELNDIDRKIKRLEERYKASLEELNALKATMATLRNADLTAVQIEGLTRLSEKLANERGLLERRLDNLNDELDFIETKLREYAEAKSDLNTRYVEIITTYVAKLNLQSINLERIAKVTDRIAADGSNAPLATVAWYFALLKLQEEFNPGRVNLPLILDSPMNVEADDDKYEMQYGLIFSTFKYKHQMLVTGLGLATSEAVPNDANVIVLENDKYQLLNTDDYDSVKDLVFSLMEQH